MTRRARSLAVVAIIAGGALSIVSSTQTWIDVVLTAGATEPVAVPGAAAVTLLAPLSLAALALGLALTVVGRVLRYVFGAIAVVIGATLAAGALRVAVSLPLDAVASTVTTTTGLTGHDALVGLVASMTPTVWPAFTAAAGSLIGVGGILTLATAHRWASGGRRYETGTDGAPASRPHDAIDSWDDLSRGDDPTSR